MTAAQFLHKWTREAEATFPNPGKIATEPTFTSDTDWRTGRLIDDTFTQQAPDSQERNAAVYLFGCVLLAFFALVPVLCRCYAGGMQ